MDTNLTLVTDLTSGDMIVHPSTMHFFGTVDGMVIDMVRDMAWLYVEESDEPIACSLDQRFLVVDTDQGIPASLRASLFEVPC